MKFAWIYILLLFFVFSFLFKTDHSFDQDLGRHIKLGEIILQKATVPKTNLFSYVNPDFPFINTHWGFEVLSYIFSQTIGLQFLLILKVVIIISAVFLVLKLAPKESALLLPIAFLFLHVLRERTELRPEIFSFFFTASTYYILEKYLKGPTKLIFLLPLIQLLWINIHIYFFVGLILQLIFLIHLLLKRVGARMFHLEGGIRWHLSFFVLLASLLISLLNPNGLKGFLYPFTVSQNYGYQIVENQTMFFLEKINFTNPNFLFAKISIGITALSLLFLLIRKNLNIKNILIPIFGIGLAFMNVRSLPYLVFLSLPAVLQNLETRKNNLTTFLSIIFAVLLLLESFFYLNGSYYKFKDSDDLVGLRFIESGSKALDFVLANNLSKPIFNNFDIGSYISYRGHPKYQIFVDGRPEAFPAQTFQETYIPIQSDYVKFKQAQDKFGFKTIIFSHTDQTPWGKSFLQNVVKDPEWNLVYIDDFMIVLTTSDVAQEKHLNVIALNQLSPIVFQFDSHVSYLRMGIFLLNTGNQISANQFLEKAYQLFPNSPILTGKNNKFFW